MYVRVPGKKEKKQENWWLCGCVPDKKRKPVVMKQSWVEFPADPLLLLGL
jgi:hypothetical protein